MSQQRNPRYWESQWYATRFANKPRPAGWYWHDSEYSWQGPFPSEEEAQRNLESHTPSRLGTGSVRHPVVIEATS